MPQREDKIKEIRRACIEANSEIVELKFGCYFLYGTWDKHIVLDKKIGGIEALEIYDDEGIPVFSKRFITNGQMELVQGFKILGRDIHLADVLLAIENTHTTWYPVDWFRYNIQLFIIPFYATSWDFRKDHLEDQSDECISFIHELIKKQI